MKPQTISFTIKINFPVSAEKIYAAWLKGDEHTKMTGAGATGSAETGSEFSAWDGYIYGRNIELLANKKIVQAWRTTDFAEKDDDSQIEITLSETETGCELMLTHTHIPNGQPDYKKGWQDYYFFPMKNYFK